MAGVVRGEINEEITEKYEALSKVYGIRYTYMAYGQPSLDERKITRHLGPWQKNHLVRP